MHPFCFLVVAVLSQDWETDQSDRLVDSALTPVTPVHRLLDVQPDDWAYQALQDLVDRYGVQMGDPDGTFRGNQTLTRSEFAAALNAFWETLSQRQGVIAPDEQQTLQRLREEFSAELTALRGRADAPETRVTALEGAQFSTTTVLTGEVVWGLSGATGRDVEANVVFQSGVQLTFETSFTGEDVLEIALEVGNAVEFSSVTDLTEEGQLDFPGDTDNTWELSGLAYEFPISDQTEILIAIDGDNLDDLNPVLGDTAQGALSKFGQENPIHTLLGDTGIGLSYEFSDALTLNLGYFAGEVNRSSGGQGLFNGDYSLLAQLKFEPSHSLFMGFTFIHAYNNNDLSTNTGSLRSQIDLERPVVGNAYGFSAFFQPSSRIAVSGWVGFTNARVIELGDADVWNYALTLAFPDLGRAGNLLGFVIGQEPQLTGTDGFLIDDSRRDPNLSHHIEAFYRYQMNDNLSITPGLIWITAPNPNNHNSDFLVFTVRTSLEF